MKFFSRGESKAEKSVPKPAVNPAGKGAAVGRKSPQRVVDTGPISIPPSVGESPNTALITSLASFPGWTDVLSGIDSATPELRVPARIQDKILAVRLTSTTALIAYEPGATQEVKVYLPVFRNALSAIGMRVDVRTVVSEVLSEIRKSGASRGTEGRISIKSSDGVKIFREWVQAAKDIGATDLHMRIKDGGQGEVSVRVDGEIEPIAGSVNGIYTDKMVKTAMVAAYETLADKHSNNLGTFSDSQSMSCMIDSALQIPNLRLRFSSQRGFFGPKAVVRLLPSEISAEPMAFSAMGFSENQIGLLEQAQRMESGVVLQIGVTGSGKTTVAKTFMESHPRNGHLAMFQVADPIEYLLRNVHQIYVQRDLMTLSEAGKKDPYSEVIESLMRMDPDVVDVGEVRDFISARALANVGKSGHLAIGTLHADSVGGAINRLTDPKLGLTRQELTSGNLIGFISYQALVPVLCQHCKIDSAEVIIAATKNPIEARYLGKLLASSEKKLDLGRDTFSFRNPEGCTHCRGRGTKGLTLVSEMMIPDNPWLDLAAEGKDRDAMRWWRETYNDRSLTSPNTNGKLVIEHAIYKASQGLIDPRNIERFGQLDKFEVLK